MLLCTDTQSLSPASQLQWPGPSGWWSEPQHVLLPSAAQPAASHLPCHPAYSCIHIVHVHKAETSATSTQMQGWSP